MAWASARVGDWARARAWQGTIAPPPLQYFPIFSHAFSTLDTVTYDE